jgi:hypothetical protein
MNLRALSLPLFSTDALFHSFVWRGVRSLPPASHSLEPKSLALRESLSLVACLSMVMLALTLPAPFVHYPAFHIRLRSTRSLIFVLFRWNNVAR